MQDINLLQNKLKDRTNQWEQNSRVVLILLSLVLAVVVAGWGVFFSLSQNATDSKISMDKDNTSIQKELDTMRVKMTGAISFQAQTNNISTLLASHVIWSNFFEELAGTTFKTSRNVGMTLDTTGLVFVEGITPTYSDLGKVLLSLETSEDLESVKLLSSSPSSGENAGVNFSLEIVVKQESLIGEQ